MNRKRRTLILIAGDPGLARTLAEQVAASYPIEPFEQPASGLVMVKARETAQRGLFFLGEVLMTECRVTVAGHTGLGLVRGDRPELCRHLAVIDAAFRAALPETAGWTEVLLGEETAVRNKAIQAHRDTLRTKVSFVTMDVPD